MDWTIKDSVTTGMATVSLAISLLTAYMNLSHRHHVTALVDHDHVNEGNRDRLQVTVANSGNQPIVIRRLKLVSYKSKLQCEDLKKLNDDSMSEDNSGSDMENVETLQAKDEGKFVPFVVKPGEARIEERYFNFYGLTNSERPSGPSERRMCAYISYVVPGKKDDKQLSLGGGNLLPLITEAWPF